MLVAAFNSQFQAFSQVLLGFNELWVILLTVINFMYKLLKQKQELLSVMHRGFAWMNSRTTHSSKTAQKAIRITKTTYVF